MRQLRLVTYEAGDGACAGAAFGQGAVVDVAEVTGDRRYRDMVEVLADWPRIGPGLRAAAASPAASAPSMDEVSLLAPLPRPGTIYCAGANYSDHAAEMAKASGMRAAPDQKALGLRPWHFIKSSRSVVGPGAVVAVPPGSSRLDWEAELAVVIGRRTKNIPVERAYEAIAGYTIANDLSARDLGRRRPMPETSPFYFDWTGQKSFDGACPLGPWIVPAEDLAEPGNLRIGLSVNGLVKQDSNTRHMIFDIAEQVSHLSRAMTLRPGDLVLTGTPAGVGAGRGEFLKAGDEVLVTVEGIGDLRHTIG